MQSVAYTFLYIRCEALYYLNGENAWGSKLFDTPSYILSCRVACHIDRKKYSRIILPVYGMQKSCLKCRSFALFKNFRGFGSKMKKIYFRDFWFSKLAICAKITIIPTKMHQRNIWKLIEKQYCSSIVLHQAVVKREYGIYLYSLL